MPTDFNIVTSDVKGFVSDVGCHICAAPLVRVVPGFETLCRVTSDCKPWPPGGRLSVCNVCGCVQKLIDDAWRAEVEKIYGGYSIYHQSDGVEQAVFDSGSGQASFRSARLLEALAARVELPDVGRMLDLGCGSGAMLRAFNNFAPNWRLTGSELNDSTRKRVESITGVEAFHVGPPEEIPGRFDIVTMIHLLEHIPRPVEYLVRLQDRLASGGLLVVEIPNYLQNPFDLLVADHSSHFTVHTAGELIERAGYQLASVATDWVPKELTVVAGKPDEPTKAATPIAEDQAFEVTIRAVEWLKQTAGAARDASREDHFGIFGTSIAATWLFNEIGEGVDFFVDEDPARIGRTFMDRPVVHPDEIPVGGHIFLALPGPLAESVNRRLARSGVTFHLPTVLTSESRLDDLIAQEQ